MSTEEYDDDNKLFAPIMAELIEKGFINSKDFSEDREKSKRIRYKLGEIYAKDMLKTNIITKNPDGIFAEKLFRIYYTTHAFRDVYGGAQSSYDM
jgi:hypothetical protein